MTQSWTEALDSYSYRFDLSDFKDADKYDRDWFASSADGNRQETMAFEARFRESAPDHLEAWYEVVYWKMYSQQGRRNHRTREVIKRVDNSKESAKTLWSLCQEYLACKDLPSFRRFRKCLFESRVIPVTATFAAFLDPEDFPMIDSQISRWAMRVGTRHSYSHCGGPVLLEVPDLENSNYNTITESHWTFVESWIEWCQFTASRLTKLTGCKWRARDAEMAVFTAECNNKDRKRMNLNPLGCCSSMAGASSE